MYWAYLCIITNKVSIYTSSPITEYPLLENAAIGLEDETPRPGFDGEQKTTGKNNDCENMPFMSCLMAL